MLHPVQEKPESLAIPTTDRERPRRYDMDVTKERGKGPREDKEEETCAER